MFSIALSTSYRSFFLIITKERCVCGTVALRSGLLSAGLILLDESMIGLSGDAERDDILAFILTTGFYLDEVIGD